MRIAQNATRGERVDHPVIGVERAVDGNAKPARQHHRVVDGGARDL